MDKIYGNVEDLHWRASQSQFSVQFHPLSMELFLAKKRNVAFFSRALGARANEVSSLGVHA